MTITTSAKEVMFSLQIVCQKILISVRILAVTTVGPHHFGGPNGRDGTFHSENWMDLSSAFQTILVNK